MVHKPEHEFLDVTKSKDCSISHNNNNNNNNKHYYHMVHQTWNNKGHSYKITCIVLFIWKTNVTNVTNYNIRTNWGQSTTKWSFRKSSSGREWNVHISLFIQNYKNHYLSIREVLILFVFFLSFFFCRKSRPSILGRRGGDVVILKTLFNTFIIM